MLRLTPTNGQDAAASNILAKELSFLAEMRT
jgi:hypothetical protein